jgi:hypothetical protein
MPAYDPPNAFYTQIELPEHINPGIFIGRDGFHLKRITELSGCEYLWMDFDRLVIEVWGPERRLPKAVRMLERRIKSFKKMETVVTEWKESYNVIYEIRGTEEGCTKELDAIFREYPHNPYFTKMRSKTVDEHGRTVMQVSRSASSD